MDDSRTPLPTLVLATPHARHDALQAALRARGLRVVRMRSPQELTAVALQALAPVQVFLPHWSWIVPAEVHESFDCVVFHMTDLPFGRGGSPLQNLVANGIYETKLSALRCEAGPDTGPIYAQRPLSLHGSAEEILLRATALIEALIIEIIEQRPAPRPQVGEATVFRRRRREDGDIAGLDSLVRVHDHIRMLDADGYPPAFLRVGRLRLEFGRSRLGGDHVDADVRITLADDDEDEEESR